MTIQPLAIITKNCIADVWQGSEYASVFSCLHSADGKILNKNGIFQKYSQDNRTYLGRRAFQHYLKAMLLTIVITFDYFDFPSCYFFMLIIFDVYDMTLDLNTFQQLSFWCTARFNITNRKVLKYCSKKIQSN